MLQTVTRRAALAGTASIAAAAFAAPALAQAHSEDGELLALYHERMAVSAQADAHWERSAALEDVTVYPERPKGLTIREGHSDGTYTERAMDRDDIEREAGIPFGDDADRARLRRARLARWQAHKANRRAAEIDSGYFDAQAAAQAADDRVREIDRQMLAMPAQGVVGLAVKVLAHFYRSDIGASRGGLDGLNAAQVAEDDDRMPWNRMEAALLVSAAQDARRIAL